MNAFTKFQIYFVGLLFIVGSFYGGYYFGVRGYEFELRRNPPKVEIINKYPGDQEVDFALFWEVWDLMQTTYLERPVDTQKMLQGAIQGMVNSVGDPYTSFLTPSLNETVRSSLDGSYQGIGAELGIRDDQLIVVAPLDGSPAVEAGIKSGDAILRIDGESTVGVTLTEAVSKIRGPAGTVSSLTIGRAGEMEPIVIDIVRGVITIESVTWEEKETGIGYIRLSRFGGDTNKDWARVVSELNAQMTELDSIILDLRGNPGGYVQGAVYIAEEFFTNKPVLYQEAATGEQIPINASRTGAFRDIPKIVVLIDEGSASASEILAAALKEHRNAVLVGETTFGKGTIQDARDFSDGSGIHITVAKWLTADKTWVHDNGIEPDVLVEFDREDYEENKIDRQLERAIELAREL